MKKDALVHCETESSAMIKVTTFVTLESVENESFFTSGVCHGCVQATGSMVMICTADQNIFQQITYSLFLSLCLSHTLSSSHSLSLSLFFSLTLFLHLILSLSLSFSLSHTLSSAHSLSLIHVLSLFLSLPLCETLKSTQPASGAALGKLG